MLFMVSCHDRIDGVWNNDAPDMTGEPVAFASGLRTVKNGTRAHFDNQGEMSTELSKFHPVVETYNDSLFLYTFDITMFRQKDGANMGHAKYQLKSTDNVYDENGTLEVKFIKDEANTPLYWPDNSNEYGFKVNAGNNELGVNQCDATHFLDNDLLLGYGFEPLWDTEQGKSFDDIDALNYRTSREWYAANKKAFPTASDADWRKIPLYLKHQRCWVTIVLKAGRGVPRNILTYDATNDNFTSKMFSYGVGGDKEITPWRRETTIHYTQDKNGPEEDYGTITLNAIVDPHDYLEATDAPITQFTLNDNKYEFMPQNDKYYAAWNEGRNASQAEKDAWTADYKQAFDEAEEAMQAYTLTAGKHLTITATLTTDRIVLITALLEDWEDISMSSICDDFGQQGDPFEIDSREKLLEFLNYHNKPGNIGLVSAPEINLDKKADGTDEAWIPRDLNCMLNLAGAKLTSKEQVFDNINSGASLLNGEIEMAGSGELKAAVCANNMGSIEQIHVSVTESARHNAYAKRGGMVDVNYGTIYNCVCDLQVKGTEGYIGGIAGESKKHATLNIQPVIDQCVVNAKVDGTDGITGAGGIVGYAENIVSRNTFNYGMTLTQQNNTKFKNIVQATNTTNEDLKVIAYGNSWPTTVTNEIGKHSTLNSNTNSAARYQAVIDSQAELQELLVNTTHSVGARYRIADDFSVDNTWALGVGDTGGYSSNLRQYNLDFELDGNDKTITTHGQRLFSHINGYFHDMTIYCAESIITTPFDDGTDMISPFAYSVNQRADGDKATIQGIKVRMATDKYIQAANPAGLICRAYGGAQIIDCEVLVDLRVKFKTGYTNHESYRYAGGISAVAVDASFIGCKVHTGTKILQDPDLTFNRQAQFRGGIVGGIVTESGYVPGTIIEDCISWWDYSTPTPDPNDSPAGAIIGSTQYIDITSSLQQGLLPGNGGNWWSDLLRPAADITGDDVIMLLGRRNNVVPTENVNF